MICMLSQIGTSNLLQTYNLFIYLKKKHFVERSWVGNTENETKNDLENKRCVGFLISFIFQTLPKYKQSINHPMNLKQH